jgi:hypothetical protein
MQEQTLITLTQGQLGEKLKLYTQQMQSEIGKSGKTLHEVFSDYLDLKNQDQSLAEKLAHFEIPNIDKLNSQKTQEQLETLRKLKNLAQRCFPKEEKTEQHPWHGLAHSQLEIASLNSFQRSLRLSFITINQFWMSFHEFCLSCAVEKMSFQEAKQFCDWLIQSADFTEIHPYTQCLPLLKDPQNRQELNEAIQEMKCLRKLHLILEKNLFLYSDLTVLLQDIQPCINAVKENQFEAFYLSDLKDAKEEKKAACQGFLTARETKEQLKAYHFPLPQNIKEWQIAKQSQEKIGAIPLALLRYRLPGLLQAKQQNRIASLKHKAQPLLEKKAELEKIFCMNAAIGPEQLKQLAKHLKKTGWFRSYSRTFKSAKLTYQGLLVHDRAQEENALLITQRLTEWASYLEQIHQFAHLTEGKMLFLHHWKGIFTDFDAALNVNQWAHHIEQQLSDPSEYQKKVLTFFFSAENEKIEAFFHPKNKEKMSKTLEQLEKTRTPLFEPLEHSEEKTKKEYNHLSSLYEDIKKLHLRPELPLKTLQEIQDVASEALFLTQRREKKPVFSSAEPKNLEMLQKICLFTQHILCLPEDFFPLFFSPKGAQRFKEYQHYAQKISKSLHAAQEQMEKLDQLTLHSFEQISPLPLSDVLNRIQIALKHPDHLKDFILYLQCEEKINQEGLSEVLHFFKNESMPIEKFEIAYGLALSGSLLKKAINKESSLFSLQKIT